jgi:lysozyme
MDLILAMSLESVQVAGRMAVAVLVISGPGLGGLAMHEKFVSEAMIPVKGDPWTGGYGFTQGVKKGDKFTPERALIRLLDEVENIYGEGIKKCITAPLYQYEYDAYLRLAYNIGVPTFCKKSDDPKNPNLIDLINSGKYADACKRIEAFNGKYITDDKGQRVKVIIQGLVNRRAEERAVCEGKRNGRAQ